MGSGVGYPACLKLLTNNYRNKVEKTAPTLPSFLAKRKTPKAKSVPTRVYTYDREIMCIPNSFVNAKGLITIPRKQFIRDFLVINKLIGNVRLRSDMTEEELMHEIRSLFSIPMKGDKKFQFKILKTCGGGSRSLSVRQTSASYKWTASTLAGKNAKCPIYILAEDDLALIKDETTHNDAEDVINISDSNSEDGLPIVEVTKRRGKKQGHACMVITSIK